MEVDEDFTEVFTINIRKSLFKSDRFTFAVTSAPAIFQQTMDTMLTGLTRADGRIDGTLAAGPMEDELLKRLFSDFRRIQQYGFHVRAEKYQFFFRTSIK